MRSYDLYDTATKDISSLRPVSDGKVSIYVCGITVHDFCHIGHIRMMVSFDVITLWLGELGYHTILARNITDFDDKILRKITERKILCQRTDVMIHYLKGEAEALGINKPDFEPRVTRYIQYILKLVRRLVKLKAAYATNDGIIYFQTDNQLSEDDHRAANSNITNCQPSENNQSLSDLTSITSNNNHQLTNQLSIVLSLSDLNDRQLTSNNSLGNLVRLTNLNNSRGGKNDGQRNSADFAVWKKSSKDNNQFGWFSPYGLGKPGWHIECSAMCQCSFGVSIEIHGGGQDLRFPHHHNEEKQNDVLLGKGYVRCWTHNGLVSTKRTKMSNSLGNTIRTRQLLREFHPEAIRFFVLCCHYRAPLEYDREHLLRSQRILVRACDTIPPLISSRRASHETDWDERSARTFSNYLNQDTSVPLAISSLLSSLKTATSRGCVPLLRQWLKLVNCLGIMRTVVGTITNHRKAPGQQLTILDIEHFVLCRSKARAQFHYSVADAMRLRLNSQGVVVNDSGDVTFWSWDWE